MLVNTVPLWVELLTSVLTRVNRVMATGMVWSVGVGLAISVSDRAV